MQRTIITLLAFCVAIGAVAAIRLPNGIQVQPLSSGSETFQNSGMSDGESFVTNEFSGNSYGTGDSGFSKDSGEFHSYNVQYYGNGNGEQPVYYYGQVGQQPPQPQVGQQPL